MTTAPGWVMFGEQNASTGVTLYASNTLTRAELVHEIDHNEYWPASLVSERRTLALTAAMNNLVVIRAADWPDAFHKLFQRWSPEPARRELTP
jgi:hypothetical protein